MTSKMEYVTHWVHQTVKCNVANWVVGFNNRTTLSSVEFNTISGRHEIECFFGIEFEQEQVDAWTTVQNIIDDVMNLWVAPISTAAERKPVKHGEQVVASIKDGKLYVNNAEISADAARRTEPLNTDRAQVAAINRIERRDVEQFKEFKDIDEGMGVPNTLDHYQSIATKSAIYPGKGTPFGLMYAALGLAEAGEVQNKVKKAFRDDGVIEEWGSSEHVGPSVMHVRFGKLTDERRKQIIKELGGVLWYIAAVCDEIGATMSEVALTNLDELCGRGERNTLRGDGDDR